MMSTALIHWNGTDKPQTAFESDIMKQLSDAPWPATLYHMVCNEITIKQALRLSEFLPTIGNRICKLSLDFVDFRGLQDVNVLVNALLFPGMDAITTLELSSSNDDDSQMILVIFSLLLALPEFKIRQIRAGIFGSPFKDTRRFFNAVETSLLTHLKMDLRQTDGAFEQLVRVLPNSKLVKINISANVGSATEFVAALQQSRVVELDLSDSVFVGNSGAELCANLPTRLKGINLFDCRLCEIALPILFNRLQEFNLDYLVLEDVSISRNEAGMLAGALFGIDQLFVSGCGIGDAGLISIFQALRLPGNSLTCLDISDNDLSRAGLEELCISLQHENCQLEILRASRNIVSMDDVTDLVFPAIRHEHCKLVELDLAYRYHWHFDAHLDRAMIDFHFDRTLLAKQLRAMLSARQVRRLGVRSALRCLPWELIRMVGEFSCCYNQAAVLEEEEEEEEEEDDI